MNKNLISKAISCLLFLLIFCAQAWSQETNTVTLVSPNATRTEGCVVGVLADDQKTATWSVNNAFTMIQHKADGTSVTLNYPEIRVYAQNSLSFRPIEGVVIQKIIATAVTDKSYGASNLGGKSIENCTKSIKDNIVTIKPINGTESIVLSNNSQARILKFEVTYTSSSNIYPDLPTTASLSFDQAKVTAYLDHLDSFVSPTLTSVPINLSDISYRSSNESVATIDISTGNVTLVGVGTTTITASCSETASHTAAEASYTLVVEESKPTTRDVAIVAQINDEWYAATTSINSDNKLPFVNVKIIDGKVVYSGNEDITWTWNEDAGTLADKKGNLLAARHSDQVGLALKNYNNVEWYIGDKGIMNKVTVLRSLFLNKTSGFDFYSNNIQNNSGYSGAAQLLPIATFATESVTTNQYGWATYAPSHKISIPSFSGVLISYIDRGHLSGSSESLTTTVLPSGTTIEGGTGILVKTESPQTTVTFTESAEPATIINNALVGVTVATNLNDETGAYIFTRKEIDGVGRIGFFPCSGGTLSANKCYLKMWEGQQSAPKFLALPDTAVTGIRSVSPKPASRRQDSATYNICGQRVSDGYSGVVIRNGRKLLVR